MKHIEQCSRDITFAVVISLTLLTACDSGKIENEPRSSEEPLAVEPPPTDEPPSTVESPPTDEPPSIVESPPIAEPPSIVETPPTDEPPPVVESPPTDEPPSVVEPAPIDEPPSVVEPPIIVEPPSIVESPPIEPTPIDSPERWVPTPGSKWVWQLQNYDDLTIDPDIGIYDIDLFDGIEGGYNSLIMKLKNAGKKVICYFSAGTREKWRPDADQFTPNSVIADGDMQDWTDETWLNIGNEQALNDTIKPIMAARLDLAQNNGCDAVEPDNVDGFDNTDETFGLITPEHQLSYNKWLAKEAHARNLSIALKNDTDQLSELVSYFDFAINEQCYAYSNECQSYENSFLNSNKAVFNQEYYTSGKSGETDLDTYKNVACPYFISVKISSLWKTGYELDGVGLESCDQ